jgi:NAD(P)-dependent dehydrogenase (short-subunit alcohol dehydrogenase family)
MNGKAAVVTGGAQGIGKAIVRRLLQRGLAVVIADADAEAGEETAREYGALGAVRFVRTDVAEETQVCALMAAAVAAHGGLDVLVNNAALATAHGGAVTELKVADWNRVLAVNLTGPLLCAKHAAPHLKARRGAIVNIASTRALMSEPHSEAYAASKGGLVALTHALALSLGPEVRVNCVCPGWIETGDWQKSSRRRAPQHSDADRAQHPAGRVGHPDDIAALVEFLAVGESGFITGANYVVDGGMTRKMIYV